MFGIAARNRRFPLEQRDISSLTYQLWTPDQGLLCGWYLGSPFCGSRFDCDPMTLTLIASVHVDAFAHSPTLHFIANISFVVGLNFSGENWLSALPIFDPARSTWAIPWCRTYISHTLKLILIN